jgi:hypothetical protein
MNAEIGFRYRKNETVKPAIATLHQGRDHPNVKLTKAVKKIETRNFMRSILF